MAAGDDIAGANLAKPTPHTRMRMERAEDLLTSGISPKRARSMLAQEWGVTSRQAARVIRYVLRQWEIESRAGREERRNMMRAKMQGVFRTAMRRKGVTVSSRGNVVEYDNPDIGGAAKILELECRLDGLLEQPETERTVIISGEELREIAAAMYGLDPPSIEAQATVRDADEDG